VSLIESDCRPRGFLRSLSRGSCAAALILCTFQAIGSARERGLYCPLEIQKAYKNETRSRDGRPGTRYWQNRAEYAITAEIDTARRAVIGGEEVYYYNDSPDTLMRLVVRLYHDVYWIRGARDLDFPKTGMAGSMVVSSCAVNDAELPGIEDCESHGTNLFIPLRDPLNPGERLKLSVRWSYRMPIESHVRGDAHAGSAYFVSCWYPQIAVYDDIAGWDECEYRGTPEHYNDFADFDVRITAPGGFVVWATGEVQNPDDVLSKSILARYAKALTSDKIAAIVTVKDRKAGGVTASGGMLTWHYAAEDVTDFAFGASDYYVWDMAGCVVDRRTGRRAVVGAAYNAESRSFRNAAEICRKTIQYLSSELPAVPYPFPSFTAFEGSCAMEFPMIAALTSCEKKWLFYHTLSHEIAHAYVPFHVGTNERKYAFMDEGWAQMLPMAFQTREIAGFEAGYDARVKNNADYERAAGREMHDRPPAALSVNADPASLHVVDHERPGAAYYFLQDVLGVGLFTTAFQEYMNRWHHRHPTPHDFYNTFNDVAGEDLSWYWRPWFFEFGYPDLAIQELKEQDGQRTLRVERRGIIPVPVKVTMTFMDGSAASFYQTPRAWDMENNVFLIAIEGTKMIKSIELGDSGIPDIDRSNNTYEAQ